MLTVCYKGLFPVADYSIPCVRPSVFHPQRAVRRQLAQSKLLRLFDVPMALDMALSASLWNLSCGPAPFEQALPPTIWAWLLRTIWGDDEGFQFLL
jgi:hypothetical protein